MICAKVRRSVLVWRCCGVAVLRCDDVANECKIRKKVWFCRRLVSIQCPPRYERITDPLSYHCWSMKAKVGVLGALPLSYTGNTLFAPFYVQLDDIVVTLSICNPRFSLNVGTRHYRQQVLIL
jgi:hypothetical protein